MLLLCKLSVLKCYQEQTLILVNTASLLWNTSNWAREFQYYSDFSTTSVIFIGTIQGILGSMPPQCKECTFLHLLLNYKNPCFITITVFSDVNFLTLLYIPKYKCFLSHTFLECVILHLGQCLLLIISKVQQYSTCLTLGRHPLWVVPPDEQNTFSE